MTFPVYEVELPRMARPVRVEVAGAVYHVMARGNHGQKICRSVYGSTTVSRRWLAEQLEMGYETRVSQAVSWVEKSRSPAVLSMKNSLKNCGIEQQCV